MRRLTIAFVLLTALGAGAASPKGAALSVAEIAERATSSVVLIKVADGVGSGFVAADGGRIATNLHVVSGMDAATVVTADGREFSDVEVMAADQAHDLVLLRVGARDLKALTLGRSANVKPGEHVVAIGHPLGLGNTVSDGLVSAVRELSPDLTFLQISAPISPGSSGGPLFNDHGQVIGIATLIVTSGQNLNFAVPINALKPMLSATEGVPIAEYAAKAGNGRHIPNHPLALLDGCPRPVLQSIVERIASAIGIGAPLYNQGNYEACYRIYASVALETQQEPGECAGPWRALLDGVDRADTLEDWSDKAWAMRDAFDGVLDVARRFDASLVDPGSPPRPALQRNVPHHPDGFLDGCSNDDVARVRDEIAAAIESGAPLYDEGNVEACYRIYEGAIRDIDRKVAACPAAKNALRDGLHAADDRPDWAGKAWALRDAFDGVLEAIDRATDVNDR